MKPEIETEVAESEIETEVAEPKLFVETPKAEADELPKRKHGRPKKSDSKPKTKAKTKAKQRSTDEELQTFAKQVAAGHAIAAAVLQMPELVLTDQEAQLLAKSIYEIMDYYNVRLSNGLLLWSQLIFTLSSVYGPRYMAFAKRKRNRTQSNPVEELARETGMPVN